MTKQLRHMALLVAVIITSLTFTACDDEPTRDHSFVGIWQMVNSTGDFYNEFTLYPDGSGFYYVEDFSGADTYSISWDAYGSTFEVYFNDSGETWDFGYSMNGNTLYLYPPEGGTWIYTYSYN